MSSVPAETQSMAVPKQNPEPKKRQSSWTCRFPIELLSIILKHLTEDKALGTLAAVQSTSRATYTFATPYLYRNILVDPDHACFLFSQFDEFPRSENRLICQPIPPDIHLLDLHLSQRLRACFSTTQAVCLELGRPQYNDWFERERLHRYIELINGLLAFGEPSLWPSLERCSLNLKPSKDQRQEASFYPSETIPIVDAVFACMRPKRFSVTYFSRSDFRDEKYKESWTPCIQRLKADHFELFGIISGDGLTFASSSMTIHFSPWYRAGKTKFVHTDLDYNINTLDRDTQALNKIDYLKLVGLAGPMYHTLSGSAHDMTETMDSITDRLNDIAGWRLPQKDLKVTIQSDTSLEGEAGAVSRIIKPQA
jgi:hypothetical protein